MAAAASAVLDRSCVGSAVLMALLAASAPKARAQTPAPATTVEASETTSVRSETQRLLIEDAKKVSAPAAKTEPLATDSTVTVMKPVVVRTRKNPTIVETTVQTPLQHFLKSGTFSLSSGKNPVLLKWDVSEVPPSYAVPGSLPKVELKVSIPW